MLCDELRRDREDSVGGKSATAGDLAAFVSRTVSVSDSGEDAGELSLQSLVSVASLASLDPDALDAPRADIVDELELELGEGPDSPDRRGPVTRRQASSPPRTKRDRSDDDDEEYAEPTEAPAPPPKKKKKASDTDGPQRRGKWTAPEEAYANVIIDLFCAGKLPNCVGGESLRVILSRALMCTPMRITKKFSRTRLIGKSCFKAQAAITREEQATLECARFRFLEHVKMADVAAPGPGDPPRRPLAAWVVHEQKAWVRDQGVDPTKWGHVTGDHSLRGGSIDASLPPNNPEQSAASASWSHFNAKQQKVATPAAAVRASVCGYTKDGKTFLRIVARNDTDFLSVLAQQLDEHAALVANLRFNAESGVAWARVEVRDRSSDDPLQARTLTALEKTFNAALRAKNKATDDQSRASSQNSKGEGSVVSRLGESSGSRAASAGEASRASAAAAQHPVAAALDAALDSAVGPHAVTPGSAKSGPRAWGGPAAKPAAARLYDMAPPPSLPPRPALPQPVAAAAGSFHPVFSAGHDSSLAASLVGPPPGQVRGPPGQKNIVVKPFTPAEDQKVRDQYGFGAPSPQAGQHFGTA